MEDLERQEYLQAVTKRLVSFTGVILLILAIGLYGLHSEQRSFLVTLVFAAGLLGGFVSIQQRLPKIKLQELQTLSTSWVSITLIPINGGIFALVLMLMFIGNIIQGELFPEYPNQFHIADAKDFYRWISLTYPQTGADIAKLFFWSFVAGFSERFVPQIIRKTSENKA